MCHQRLADRLFWAVTLGAAIVLSGGTAQCDPGAEGAAGPPAYRLPDARQGQFFEYSVAFRGMVEPVAAQWGPGKPSWLKGQGPVLRGTPDATGGPFRFGLTLKDALGRTLHRTYEVVVRPPLTPLRLARLTLPAVVVGEDVEHEFAAEGGEGVRRWKSEAVERPRGLEVVLPDGGARCLLTGKPTEAGRIVIRLSVSDWTGETETLTVNGVVAPARTSLLRLETKALPDATVGTPYLFPFHASGGKLPYKWSLEWGASRPEGMNVDTEQAVLSGAPGSSGMFRLKASVTDALGAIATAEPFELAVKPLPIGPFALWPKSLPPVVAGRVWEASLVALNPQGKVVWEVEIAPKWLRHNASGATLEIKGTPPGKGLHPLRVKALDTGGAITQVVKDYEIEAVEELPPPAPLRIVTSELEDAAVGVPYSFHVKAAGGLAPHIWRFEWKGPEPSGIRADTEAGALTGVAAAAGKFRLDLTVVDSRNEQARAEGVAFHVKRAPGGSLTVVPGVLPLAVVGRPFDVTLAAQNAQGEVVWQVDQLPAWLLSKTSGSLLRVSGKPPEKGKWLLKLGVVDEGGVGLSASAGLEVQAVAETQPPEPVQIVTEALPTGVVGVRYVGQVVVRGGVEPIVVTCIHPDSPWLSVGPEGTLGGIPLDVGQERLEFTATDARGVAAKASLPLVVVPTRGVALTLPAMGPVTGIVGRQMTYQIPVRGGVPPYIIQLSGVPSWLHLDPDKGLLAGVPDQPGRANVIVTVTDATRKQTLTGDLAMEVTPERYITWPAWLVVLAAAGFVLGARLRSRGRTPGADEARLESQVRLIRKR